MAQLSHAFPPTIVTYLAPSLPVAAKEQAWVGARGALVCLQLPHSPAVRSKPVPPVCPLCEMGPRPWLVFAAALYPRPGLSALFSIKPWQHL